MERKREEKSTAIEYNGRITKQQKYPLCIASDK
jgi:hypothetical protein